MSVEQETRIDLATARTAAEELIELLRHDCERIEIAGSIRREKETVKDIELVAIPKVAEQHDLFGEPTGQRVNKLRQWIDGAAMFGAAERPLQYVSGRDRMLKLLYGGIPVDIFMVLPPAQWGAIFAIRTGPADFNKLLVTSRMKGGFMPPGMQQHDGALWSGDPQRGGVVIETPEESDWFDAIGVPTWDPPYRSVWRLEQLRAGASTTRLAQWRQDRAAAIEWAQDVADDSRVVYLDTETTGLDERAQVIEIGIADADGRTILDTLVKSKFLTLPQRTTELTGITEDDLMGAPSWADVGPRVVRALQGKRVIVYNAEFDRPMVERKCRWYGIGIPAPASWECAMQAFAAYAGEWNHKRGSYRWHQLSKAQSRFCEPSATHRALDDALACRDVVLGMAKAGDSE